MSYINDALKRAQKERDGRYTGFGPILQNSMDGGVSRKKFRPAMLAWASALVIVVAAIVFAAVDFKTTPPPSEGPERTSGDGAQIPPSLPQAALKRGAEPVALPVAQAEAQKLDPEKAYARALEKQKAHRLSEAEALYKKILARDPEHIRSLNNLGVIYMSQGRKSLAAETFRKALAIRKDYVDPYYNLACLHVRNHDLREGLRYLREAAALDSKVREWAREDADLRPLQELPEYRSFLSEH